MARQKNNDLPIQYRFGGAWFCELPFFVSRHVLIPRFDTETLCDAVICRLSPNSVVLDLCCGSGCVGVVLARHGMKVVSADISKRALRVAKKNAKFYGENIEFVHSDLFENLGGRVFDAVVCNPPYVKTDELGKWDSSTLHEPRIALDGGFDGLIFYRKIVEFIGQKTPRNNPPKKGGQNPPENREKVFSRSDENPITRKVFFEIDYRAKDEIKKILEDGGFGDIEFFKDTRGLERVVYGRLL